MTPSRLHISLFLALAAALWAALLWLRGHSLGWEHLWPFGLVVSLLTLVYATFEKYIWAWRFVQGSVVVRPDIRGTWRARLVSEWVDPATGSRQGEINGYMTIRQSLNSLSMRFLTVESTSTSVAHSLFAGDDGVFRLVAVYQNIPLLALRGRRSEIHFGALAVEIHGEPPSGLDGEYWTDRGTRGRLILSDRTRQVFSSHASAEAALAERIEPGALLE